MEEFSWSRLWRAVREAVGLAQGAWVMVRRIGYAILLLGFAPLAGWRDWLALESEAIIIWMTTVLAALALSVQAIYLKQAELDRLTAIPEPDRELVRLCRKSAGKIHDALTGFRIPDPATPDEKVLEGIEELDQVSGFLAEYEPLHRAITEYKVCVVHLLPMFRKTLLTDTAAIAHLLEPEGPAYLALLRESARLLGLRPPEDPPPTKSGS